MDAIVYGVVVSLGFATLGVLVSLIYIFPSKFGYIILNESTGKILKSNKYTPANFSSLLN